MMPVTRVFVNSQNIDGHTVLMFAYNGKNQVETLWECYSQFVSDAKLKKSSSGAEEDGAAVVADKTIMLKTGANNTI